MLDFFTASQNVPFAIALGLLLMFLVIEMGGLLMGAEVGGLLGDAGLADVADAGLDSLPGGEGMNLGVVSAFLYWLNVGRVPVFILLILLLTFFVVAGYTLQYLLLGVTGHMLPWYLASPAALLAAMPAVRASGRVAAKVIPRDETEAVSQSELVGSRAVIVLGTAKKDGPAQARANDRFGTTQYVMVEPDDPEAVLEPGRELLLVRCEGNRFYAIYHPDAN